MHIDLWGPYKVPTYNGFKYFMTIVDDHSRSTWIHLVKNKASAFATIQGFIQYVQTQFQVKVKCIRT